MLSLAQPSRAKRTASGDDADDALSSILGKLGLGAGSTIASDREAAVTVLMEVLLLEHEPASFLLESAADDVAVAVSLHFDLSGGGAGKRSKVSTYETQLGSGASALGAPTSTPLVRARWARRQVEIAGLPDGWTAHVSRTSGNVYFRHVESQHVQNCVPPGFADAPSSGGPAGADYSAEAGQSEEGAMEEYPADAVSPVSADGSRLDDPAEGDALGYGEVAMDSIDE